MRRWRVGTVSIGILLIVLGVVMLAAQLKQKAILDMLLTWWPLVLVLIGGEILDYVYTAKEPEPRIKYDAFSMFLVFVILFCSICAYAITASGAVERFTRMADSRVMELEIPVQGMTVDGAIRRIVVFASGGKLDIKKSSTAEAVSFGQAAIYAADRQEAEDLLKQIQTGIHREGDTLFIQYLSPAWQGNYKPYVSTLRHTLLLPAGIDVEISGSGHYQLAIESQAIDQNWFIKGTGEIDVTVGTSTELAIDVLIKDSYQLRGNVNWDVKEILDDPAGGNPLYQGHLKWGEGGGNLNIILEWGTITVNEI